MTHPLLHETIWYDQCKHLDAERTLQEQLVTKQADGSEKQYMKSSLSKQAPQISLVDEIAQVRQHIKNSLMSGDAGSVKGCSTQDVSEMVSQLQHLEIENTNIKNIIANLTNLVSNLDARVNALENKNTLAATTETNKLQPPKPVAKNDDDDIDLFGSDEEEDQEANKLREKRLEEYQQKKSKKPAVIAKSSVVLDIKPWDDETDLKLMEKQVRKIETDGLLWGAARLVPLAYGIHKLQISCVVEDEKVSIDWLQEKIEELEEVVQSVDIASFNKI
ncbi:LOW QUALITY PROTEIN: elongation factor 1-delta-like [Limulus polyphemus]|uniref:LOW QUALITY PROTEIN: elongation factor 1-delta-like n=1 Tax=Limulus polyphemus TaxID=6850 RepID=A0ABM1B5M8_LIMPO|nr:LOW QUALITY PROTEIN: elongation factor 1-delta-like [Limulus polyphemus]